MTDMTDAMDPQERRRQRDREDQARRRAEARGSGEPLGHALDSIIIDGIALMLAGREMDDPVRLAWTRSMARAIRARRKAPTPALARRLQARLTISSSLETAIVERRVEDLERRRGGSN